MERRRRLADGLAGAAAELLPHMLGHEPLARNDIEGLGDILADLRQVRAAAARARGRRRVNDAPPRQMIGEIPPRPLAPREALDLDARRLGLRLILAGGRGGAPNLAVHLSSEPPP